MTATGDVVLIGEPDPATNRLYQRTLGAAFTVIAASDEDAMLNLLRTTPIVALVLEPSASKPTAVLELPVVSLVSAVTPTAVLELPVVTFKSALSPKTVLSLVKQPSRQTARAAGESAMARMPSALRRICCKTRRELNIRTVVLTSMGIEGYIGNFFLLPV